MNKSSARNYYVAAACAVAVVMSFIWGPPLLRAQENDDLHKRIAAVEAGQKAILKELQEIKAMLQARPVPLPTPVPGAAPTSPQAVPNIDLDVAGAPMRGSADAKLTLIEFSDFECPFCARFTRDTLPQLKRDYVDTDKVRYVFRHFPLERMHPKALKAAEAAECARTQGKFWELHTRLFANQQALGPDDLVKHAQALGLNMPSFQQCLAGQATARIRQDQADGARGGITGTPTFFIGTTTKDGKVKVLRKLTGAQPYANFKTALDGLLAVQTATK